MALDAETREQLIDTVRRFVAERLRPLECKVAEDDALPADLGREPAREAHRRRLGRAVHRLLALALAAGVGDNREDAAPPLLEHGRQIGAGDAEHRREVALGAQQSERLAEAAKFYSTVVAAGGWFALPSTSQFEIGKSNDLVEPLRRRLAAAVAAREAPPARAPAPPRRAGGGR